MKSEAFQKRKIQRLCLPYKNHTDDVVDGFCTESAQTCMIIFIEVFRDYGTLGPKNAENAREFQGHCTMCVVCYRVFKDGKRLKVCGTFLEKRGLKGFLVVLYMEPQLLNPQNGLQKIQEPFGEPLKVPQGALRTFSGSFENP